MRDPAPVWLRIGLVIAVLVASAGGWAITTWAQAARSEALRVAAVAAAVDREAELAEREAAQASTERDALAALVAYRCDTGTITDPQTCRTAREYRR